MANPILSQPDAFSRRAPQGYAPPQYGGQAPYTQPQFGGGQQYGQPQFGQQYGQPQFGQQYGQPQQGYGQPGYDAYGQAPQQFQQPGQMEPPMTLDDVIGKTGITMLTLMASAVAAFLFMPPALMMPALILSALVGFVTVMLVAARKKINPALVLFYSVIEGVFIGAFSAMFEYQYPGIVSQAVLGTFAAAGATLAAYKFFNIRVSSKVRRMVFITTAAFAGVMLINFVLALFGINMGMRSGVIGLVAALLGAGLAVFNLVIDFDDIERGIAMNAPASESWRAAFGLTVTMVWLYTEILRLLSYFRRD